MTNTVDKSPKASGWQAEKSASTRNQILDAAIQCFVELGYTHTTTAKISATAGLSRGAMLHHFPSRMKLIAAAIAYLHKRRLSLYREAVGQIGHGEDRLENGIDAYWQQLLRPEFIAFHELTVAARTDEQLRVILQPAITDFDAEWAQATGEVFPEWQATGEIFRVASLFTQSVMEGMAFGPRRYQAQDGQRYSDEYVNVLAYLKHCLRELFTKGTLGLTLEDIIKDDA